MSLFRSSIYNSITPSPYQTGLFDSTPKLPRINRVSRVSDPQHPRGTVYNQRQFPPRISDPLKHQTHHHTTPSLQITPKPFKKKAQVDLFTDTGRQSLSKIVSQFKSTHQSSTKNRYKQHQFNTFQSLKFIRSLPPMDLNVLQSKLVPLPVKAPFSKTTVFDLDQTLVHCNQYLPAAHTKISIRLPNSEKLKIGLNIRPGARELLESASRHSEVIIFTASTKVYADAVLDFLDPFHEFIHHRLYRQSCIPVNGVYIKDLRILSNRELRNISIVDNLACSFGYQVDNGVPIMSWYEDMKDRELFKLADYLRFLADKPDVRVVHRKFFALNRFYEDYLSAYIKPKNNQS